MRCFIAIAFLIPSIALAQSVQSVRVTNTSGQSVAAVINTAPTGTEYGLAVRMIGTITATISGTVAATQSGIWSVRTQDGSGNSLTSSTAAPGAADRGLVVRLPPAASVVSGQQAVTASAVALPSVSVQQVCVKHVVGGSQSVIYVGPSGITTSTGYPLEQGDSACYATDSVADLFVIASGTGSSVAYTGVP
mgnify:FL=1